MARILVIEDEEYVRDIICEMLSAENFEVIESANGKIGVQLAEEKLPDLIICDVMMPELDGYGVLEKLKKNKYTQTIPFIFLTAKAAKKDLRQGMNEGADDYITKPFTRDSLLKTVTVRLEKKAAMVQESEETHKILRDRISFALPHELRTPLNGITMSAELLVRYSDSMEEEEIKELGNNIKISAQRLHHLIQNFLLYVKLELVATNPADLKALLVGEVDSSNIIISIIAEKKARRWQREKDLELQLEEAAIFLKEKWLMKISEELIDNAFKYSSVGTPVQVKSSTEGDKFILEISDRGRGMTPQEIKKVGAYMQFKREMYEQQGSGLGLAICKRLTELYGGNFIIDSIPEKETTVKVILPLK